MGIDKNIDTVEFSLVSYGRQSQMDEVHETLTMDGVIGICLHTNKYINIYIYICMYMLGLKLA